MALALTLVTLHVPLRRRRRCRVLNVRFLDRLTGRPTTGRVGRQLPGWVVWRQSGCGNEASTTGPGASPARSVNYSVGFGRLGRDGRSRRQRFA